MTECYAVLQYLKWKSVLKFDSILYKTYFEVLHFFVWQHVLQFYSIWNDRVKLKIIFLLNIHLWINCIHGYFKRSKAQFVSNQATLFLNGIFLANDRQFCIIASHEKQFQVRFWPVSSFRSIGLIDHLVQDHRRELRGLVPQHGEWRHWNKNSNTLLLKKLWCQAF